MMPNSSVLRPPRRVGRHAGLFAGGSDSLFVRTITKISFFLFCMATVVTTIALAFSQFATTTTTPTYHQDDSPQERFLQRGAASDQQRGRTILTFLYLCVLGLCFMTPVLYYCRLHYEERSARQRLRQLELQGLELAIQRSNNNNNSNDNNNMTEESRAARRKYLEERRARLVQLVAPVRMVLTEKNFPGQVPSANTNDVTETAAAAAEEEEEEEEEETPREAEGEDDILVDVETDTINDNDGSDNNSQKKKPRVIPADVVYGDDDEEEDVVIELPAPGLHSVHFGGGSSSKNNNNTAPSSADEHSSSSTTTTASAVPTRQASGLCPICICAFEVGSDVVWSSNENCEHCFHAECIVNWLLRQPEGPLCPCCRRDFIVDPFDILEQPSPPPPPSGSNDGELANNNNSNNDDDDNNSPNRSSPSPTTTITTIAQGLGDENPALESTVGRQQQQRDEELETEVNAV